MYIEETCIGCKRCLPYCPVQAITYIAESKKAEIDLEVCVECGICRNADCPTDSIQEQELIFPRLLRKQFSNPLITHPNTGVPGRGTEEMKTNDVTGRFKYGTAGVAIEMGRPGTGTSFRDVQLVAEALAPVGVSFEPENPVTKLMDIQTGKLNDEVLGERALSAIIEFDVVNEKLPDVFRALKEVTPQLNTLYSLDLASRLDEEGNNPVLVYAEEAGLPISIDGKTNVGLGKPLFKEEK